VKGGIFAGGFLENWQDTNLDLMKRGFLRGLSEKRASSSFFISNRAGELSAGGLWQRRFRRLGHEGLWQEGEAKRSPQGTRKGTHQLKGRAEDGRRRSAEASAVAQGGGGVLVIDWQ
jgi:hypothetical protein